MSKYRSSIDLNKEYIKRCGDEIDGTISSLLHEFQKLIDRAYDEGYEAGKALFFEGITDG